MAILGDLHGASVEVRGQIKLKYLRGLHVAPGSDLCPIISLPPASGGHIPYTGAGGKRQVYLGRKPSKETLNSPATGSVQPTQHHRPADAGSSQVSVLECRHEYS